MIERAQSLHNIKIVPLQVLVGGWSPEEQQLKITNVLDAEQEGVSVDEVLADWVAL